MAYTAISTGLPRAPMDHVLVQKPISRHQRIPVLCAQCTPIGTIAGTAGVVNTKTVIPHSC